MDIETAGARRIENGLGQKKPIGDDNDGVWFEPGKGLLLTRVLEADGGADLDVAGEGIVMDRRQPFGHATPGGSRGLRIAGADLVAGLDQTGERGHREV